MKYEKGMWLYWKPKAYYSEEAWVRVDSPYSARDTFMSNFGFVCSEVGKFEVFYSLKQWYKVDNQVEMTSSDQRNLFKTLFESKRVIVYGSR
jgi:hypothetical protein